MMNTYRNLFASAGLVLVLTACGSHAVPTLNGRTSTGSLARVAFSITLPSRTASSRHAYYVSGSTAYAEINVKNAGGFNQNTEITCAYPTCSGTVAAPIGSDTFAVNLVNLQKTPLSTGTVTQSIAAGNNAVAITFNPVVASVSLAYDASALSGGYNGVPELNPIQYTKMLLDVTALDASGQTIVGPGVFVDSSGNPITVTLSDSDAFTMLSTTSFTSPGSTTLSVANGLTHASPYEDAVISVSAPGVANVSGLAVAFAPTMQNVGANSAFGEISGTYGDTAIATIGGNTATQVDFNAAGGAGLHVSSVPNGQIQANCGSIGNLTGGTSDKMLYFVVNPGQCGYPPPGGWPGPAVYQADPLTYSVTDIASSNNASNPTQFLSGPLGVGADGEIWYVEQDGSPNYYVHMCHYVSGGSASCTSDEPQITDVDAYMPGPNGQTLAITNHGTGVALIASNMAVTTQDLSSQLSASGVSFGSSALATTSWGYSPADRQIYFWGSALGAVSTTTWQVSWTKSIFAGNGGFGVGAEGAEGPMTVLSDGSLVTAGGVIFRIHPVAGGPAVVSQELPLLGCGTCDAIANASSLLPDGTITQFLPSGTQLPPSGDDIEYATW